MAHILAKTKHLLLLVDTLATGKRCYWRRYPAIKDGYQPPQRREPSKAPGASLVY